MPTEEVINRAAAILDRVGRNLKGTANMHRAGLESIPTLRSALNVAQIEIELARDLLREKPVDQSKLF